MKKVLLFLAGIAIVAISCTKEVEIQKPEDSLIPKKVLTVTVNTPETKTVLNAERSGLEWTTGDNFRLMSNTATSAHDATTLTYVADGKFTPTVSSDATEVYAYYFAGDYTDANHSNPSAYSAYINSQQTQSEAGVLNGQNLPMAAKGTINSDNTVTLNFHQMASVLALNIYASSKVSGEMIKSVTVTPTGNTKFAGVRTSTDLTVDDVIYDEGTSTNYTNVKVTLTNAYDYTTVRPTSSADKRMFNGQIYVVLAKQNYPSLKFEIETNKGVYTITGSSFDLTQTDFLPVNINLKSTAATYEAHLLNKVFFEETFAGATGTMGWSGSVASGTLSSTSYDNSGWTVSNGYGAGGAIRLGKSSGGKGSATTPGISVESTYNGKDLTLSFKAGAWSGDNTNLKLSATNADLSKSSVTLVSESWSDYEVTVSNWTSGFTIKFEGNGSSKSRFFIDDVKLAYTKGVDLDPDAKTLTFDKSFESFLAIDNSFTSKFFTVSSIQNVSTWSISNNNTADFTASADVDNGKITVCPTGVNNTYSSKTAKITVTADGVDPIELSVSQAAKVAVFTVTPSTTSKIESSEDDTQYLTINANIPWTLSLDDENHAMIVNIIGLRVA